jgi:hypothetical protein
MTETQQPPQPVPVHPDLLAFAKQTLDMKEIMDGLEEIRRTGGVPIEEVQAMVAARVRGE